MNGLLLSSFGRWSGALVLAGMLAPLRADEDPVRFPRDTIQAVFNSATDVPVTANGYTAAGNSVVLSLNFPPVAGVNLTVVNNTSPEFINGRFTNLTQGQTVELAYGGINYDFVAHYYGGTGNDLVLHWADTRVMIWPWPNLTAGNLIPTNAFNPGVLSGKTVVSVAAGGGFRLALCSDGTLAAWGSNASGQLGNNSTANSDVPVAVNSYGVLAGRTVIAIAAGGSHSHALCADGTLAAWGSNNSGPVPVAVDASGALAGKTVAAIAAGGEHSLALCTDGTMAAWGYNGHGRLGTGQSASRVLTPQNVFAGGPLSGRKVIAVAAGGSHSLALREDGIVVAWGNNTSGQVGSRDGTQTYTYPTGGGTYSSWAETRLPVAVSWAGVTAIAAGGYHSVALCSDGTVATWGENGNGELGNNGTMDLIDPVAVQTFGVLAQKRVSAVSAGGSHTLALCTDGTVASWGDNAYGELGTGDTVDSRVPVTVKLPVPGAKLIKSGTVLVAWPLVATLPVVSVTATGATLHGVVSQRFSGATVSFEYGRTTAYGDAISGTLTASPWGPDSEVVAGLTNLEPLSEYRYRLRVDVGGVTLNGADQRFVTPAHNDATLASLTLSEGALTPGFAGNTFPYTATVAPENSSIRVTPVVANSTATVRVNGLLAASGNPSAPIALGYGRPTTVTITVTAQDGTIRNYTIAVTRPLPNPVAVTFSAAGQAGFSTNGLNATGHSVSASLDFAPPAGTDLMLINNSDAEFIAGAFSNLAHGRLLDLSYHGVTYRFVANYYGGTGNDLVLQWADTRLVAWGNNSAGQLGDGSSVNRLLPSGVDRTGVLLGKTILAVTSGWYHNVALCSDGTLAAWGDNSSGQLGNDSLVNSAVPVAVQNSGALAGKTVIVLAGGLAHSLALCSDGTVAAWGDNADGQLGNNTLVDSRVPVAVNRSGVLSNKTVIAVAAGGRHSLALCSDGTLAAWGRNAAGQLGNGGSPAQRVPSAVYSTGVLGGRTVRSIAAGADHTLVLCTDGTIVGWGSNADGQLGFQPSSVTSRLEPVIVPISGVLGGTTAIVAGANHNLVLSADGRLASWGRNADGQLGRSAGSHYLPGLVPLAGALTGRIPWRIGTGERHSLAWTSDGVLAVWGANEHGQLGNDSTTGTSGPVAVGTSTLPPGERFVAGSAGARHSLSVVTHSPSLDPTTLHASSITWEGAVLHGHITTGNSDATLSFEYGETTAYGSTASATPSQVSSRSVAVIGAVVSGLKANTLYHYRVAAVDSAGTITGSDATFVTRSIADDRLDALVSGAGPFTPAFTPGGLHYAMTVPETTATLRLTPLSASGGSITINDAPVQSGSVSSPIPLAYGENVVRVVLVSRDGSATRTYTVVVVRVHPNALAAVFGTAEDTGATGNGYTATGRSVTFMLTFAPPAGTNLTVVNNSALTVIEGTFTNLAHGQTVTLYHAGVPYEFVANYYGGTGNDLVLHWAGTGLMAWGANTNGQLGDTTTTSRLVPVVADRTGVLAGRTVLATASGWYHNLALCSDGTLAAWGDNSSGQLGNGSVTSSAVPVEVQNSGVLAGKTVVAVAAGLAHSLALCSDGTVAAWGYNASGQLGDDSLVERHVPVAVYRGGFLAGKTVVAIAAGRAHSLALCSDGVLASWGADNAGQLGLGAVVWSVGSPRAVYRTQGLAARTVTSIAAGADHTLVLCSDGTMFAWGSNDYRQLGTASSPTLVSMPTIVPATGVLSGRTITAIAAGATHSLVLCSDGLVATWGSNANGQLGRAVSGNTHMAGGVIFAGPLEGRRAVRISAGERHSLAWTSDGMLAAWGDNSHGQLGNNSTLSTGTAAHVETNTLPAGARLLSGSAGARHSLAVVTRDPVLIATTLDAGSVTYNAAILRGHVVTGNSDAVVDFEYGETPAYGSVVRASPGAVSARSTSATSVAVGGLKANTRYYYRVRAADGGGTAAGGEATFVTRSLSDASLDALIPDGGTLFPAYRPEVLHYWMAVPESTSSLRLTPVSASEPAIRINDTALPSGSSSTPIPLTVGENTIRVEVVSRDGSAARTYRIEVIRLTPNGQAAIFVAAGDVGATGNGFSATGRDVTLSLTFAPPVGTHLTVVNNTATAFIEGRFANLAHGQLVALHHAGISYYFVANYYGGTGNDLVLHWAGTRLLAWGGNANSQLGDGTTTDRAVPAGVDHTGALANKTILAVASGHFHNMAVCSDGTVASWGDNSSGQLGNNSRVNSAVPVAIQNSGALAGKTVVTVAAGFAHSLALCSDGTVAAWGYNSHGQLGNNSFLDSQVPVPVDREGVLSGKTVVAVAAGTLHSLVLCSDGSMASWGDSYNFQVTPGQGATNVPRPVPVAAALAGKTVTSISAGGYFNLLLCADGTVAGWGSNSQWQLAYASWSTGVPVPVPTVLNTTSVFEGRTVTGIAAGGFHSLALCSDGRMIAWGKNSNGEVGQGLDTSTYYPALVLRGVALTDRTPFRIWAGGSHNLALCTDGTMAAWGANHYGQLSQTGSNQRWSPVLVNSSALQNGERFSGGSAGLRHTLAVVDTPFSPDLELWRRTWFGPEGATGEGEAADASDFDHDRLPNLIEWACHSNPAAASESPFAVAQREGVIEFTAPRSLDALADGLVFTVEWSDTLAEGSWSAAGVSEEVISQDSTVRIVKSTVPAGGGGRRFVRLRVTTE